MAPTASTTAAPSLALVRRLVLHGFDLRSGYVWLISCGLAAFNSMRLLRRQKPVGTRRAFFECHPVAGAVGIEPTTFGFETDALPIELYLRYF